MKFGEKGTQLIHQASACGLALRMRVADLFNLASDIGGGTVDSKRIQVRNHI